MPLQDVSELGKLLNQHPFFFCCPIQLVAPTCHKIFNGTMTFVKIDCGLKAGITCYHVLDKFLDLLGEDDKSFIMIGNLTVRDLEERIIDHSVSNDIAIFNLEGVPEIRDFGLGIAPQFCEPVTWPPSEPTEGGITTFGGFPGQWREERSFREHDYSTFSLAGETIEDVRETSFKISFVPDRHENADMGRKTANDLLHYGGLSGCPVFVQRDMHLELIGIIRAGGDIFFEATRLDVFDQDYKIHKFP